MNPTEHGELFFHNYIYSWTYKTNQDRRNVRKTAPLSPCVSMYLLLQIKFYVTRGQYSDVYLNNQKFIRGVTVSGIWTVDAVWEGVTHIYGGITSLCGEL